MHFVMSKEQYKQNAQSYLEGLPVNENRPMVVTFEEHVKSRSKAQNRLYWSWIAILSKDAGYTKNELHKLMRRRFLGHDKIVVEGEPCLELISTTDLNVDEFTEYLRNIEQVAIELEIVLPVPGDYEYAMTGRWK